MDDSSGTQSTRPDQGTAWRRAAAFRRTRLRPVWRDVRPFVVLGAGLIVLVLGTIGFDRHPSGEDFSLLDSFYRTLLLFGFGGAVDPPVPWQLQVARIIAPLLTGYAAVQGLLALSREQLQLLGLRVLLREHVVVAGLGDAGFRLAVALNDAGLRVVAIERDPGNPALAGCRERGISVLAGDATDARILERAVAMRARHLVVTCGRDGTNVDVAAAARDVLPARRSGALTALVQVDDLGLWRALQAEMVARAGESGLRLEMFNLFESAARMMLAEHPPPWRRDGSGPDAAPILIVGLEGVGESLLLNLAGLWMRERPGRKDRLPIALAAPEARDQVAHLLARYPELEGACRLEPLPVDLDSPVLQELPGLARAVTVYVALLDEADSLAAGLVVASGARPSVPVVVAVADEDAGVARALRHAGPSNVRPFGVMSRTLRPELLLQGTNEALARAKHDQYVRAELSRGATPQENRSLVDWEQLPESLRESNRRFAEGIGAKLRAAGCGVVPAPLIDPSGPLLRFTEEEVEELSQLEHDRWASDLLLDGWRPTTGDKDPVQKLHPLIVPWAELPESEREKDREPMRELPEMLARAGFELYRLPSA